MLKRYSILFFILFLCAAAQAKEIYPSPRAQKQFFQMLLPHIRKANQTIMLKRKALLHLYHLHQQDKALSVGQREWLEKLAMQYKTQASNWQSLINRVDIVPVALALGQSDKETAGGTTRFAKAGNNYYGMWCHTKGCGLVPKERPAGQTYEVERFPTIQASVDAYMHNLNTNKHYKIFRDLRAQMRHLKLSLNSCYLLHGLLAYSTLRYEYLNDICKIIHKFNLEQYQSLPDNFSQFKSNLKQKAMAARINKTIIKQVFPTIKNLKPVKISFKKQPEFHSTFNHYQAMFITPKVVRDGKAYLEKYQPVLQEIQKQYKVQPSLIVALIGMETKYGKNMGDIPVFSALATMAYVEPRRRAFFMNQFITGLKLLQQKKIAFNQMKGSWAGAMGLCQFLPVRFMKYAKSWSGVSKVDIWHNPRDAFVSTANFFHQNGWDEYQGVAVKLFIPKNVLQQSNHLFGLKHFHDISYWQKLGIQHLPAWAGETAIIFSGKNQSQAYLINHNFMVLLKWNASFFYVLTVDHLRSLL